MTEVIDQPGADQITLQNNAVLRNISATAITSVTSANIVDGTIVDADINAAAGIQLSKLGHDAWTTYTPALTATTTNPTFWTLSGRYTRVGRLIVCTLRAVVTASSTVGSGAYRLSLDVACDTNHTAAGSGYVNDNSTGINYQSQVIKISSTTVAFNYLTIDFGLGSYSFPSVGSTFAPGWATNDSINLVLSYEASS